MIFHLYLVAQRYDGRTPIRTSEKPTAIHKLLLHLLKVRPEREPD